MAIRTLDKVLKVILSAGILLSIGGYIGWTLVSDNLSAIQAEIHPLLVLQQIVSQIMNAAPLSDWNFPFLSIGIWAVWVISIYSAGLIITNKFSYRSDSVASSAQAVISFAVGFVFYGILQLVVGLVGYARIPLILIFFIGTLICLARRTHRDELLRLPRAMIWQWKSLSPLGRLACVAFMLPIFMLLAPALPPPVQSDGMRYHLGAVQEYLKLGAIQYLPHNAYSNMPFLVEMHFLGALACNAPEATQLMHMTLAIFAALAIYGIVLNLAADSPKSHTARYISLLPSALYLGTPMSGVLATWPFTDHGISFFLLASLLAALICSDEPVYRKPWILLGVCLGGLIGVKYTMGPVAVVIMAIPWVSSAPPRKILLFNTAVALVIMAIIGGTWYIKNAFFTTNPFYPLVSAYFPGGDWTSANDQFLQSKAGAKGMGRGFVDMLLLPWNATFRWVAFEAHNPGVTILVATLTALCAIISNSSRKASAKVRSVLMVTLLTFVIWFFTYQSNRLLLPTIAIALCLTPLQLLSGKRLATYFYSSAIALATACGFAWAIQWSWVATGLTPPPLPYLLGVQDQKTYRYHSLTYARAFDYLNQHVALDEKVLLVGEHRIFGARFTALWSDWFDTPMLVSILRKNNIFSTHELLTHLRSKDIDWILINERELAPQLTSAFKPWFSPREWKIFEELRLLKGTDIEVINLPPGVTILHLTEAGK